jgi:hypothetical protein
MGAMFVAALAVPKAFGRHGVVFDVAFLIVIAMQGRAVRALRVGRAGPAGGDRAGRAVVDGRRVLHHRPRDARRLPRERRARSSPTATASAGSDGRRPKRSSTNNPSAVAGRIDKKKRRELTADLAGRLECQVMTNDVT